MKISILRKRGARALNLPTISLLAFLQRTPVLQVAATAGEFITASPVGTVLKSCAAIAASLGAMNSLAGATPLVPSSGTANGVTVDAGTAVSVAYTVTGTQTPPASWRIQGTFPPGLKFSGLSSTGTVNVQNLQLSGTATTAGSYMVQIQAFQGTNASLVGSPIYDYTIMVTGSTASGPSITTQPQATTVAFGGNTTLMMAATGSPTPTFQWWRDGAMVAGATGASLAVNNAQPSDAGLYSVVATNSAGTATSDMAILGVSTTMPVVGSGSVVGTNIVHPNGNHFDQVLVTGAAETITAVPGRVTRTSFIDLNGDLVQVEFSGAGTLSLVLDAATGPAAPVNYNQPTVSYMTGHAGIVITGANETTNVSVFTVGRATAFDPTGAYNILQAPGPSNDPAKNGSSLFVGHDATHYDGIADIAFIAITSTDGKFGGVRTSNANYFAAKGLTGVYAPGVAFQGPLYIGDLDASDQAQPVIMVGSVADARITGGDLHQDNSQPVQVAGLTKLEFTAGGDSAGNVLPAQPNHAVLMENGQNVTAQIVASP